MQPAWRKGFLYNGFDGRFRQSRQYLLRRGATVFACAVKLANGMKRGIVYTSIGFMAIALMACHKYTSIENGKGLASEPRSASVGPGGFGLTGMRERAMLLNGTMQIKSEPGVGTFLTMEFPVGVREPSWAT